MTINSQPHVNGVNSKDPVFGWGPAKGFIYQKAYFEFFVSPDLLKPLVTFLEQFDMVSFQAINVKGEEICNIDSEDVNAVTWGVFPNSEVIQPTVVDHQAFKIWKDEAFAAWLEWASIYELGSCSANFLQGVHDTYYLMNVVDNDYTQDGLSNIISKFIGEHEQFISKVA